jgi:aryl-alcohol dehydrogenase-like predicted oxidoreductase
MTFGGDPDVRGVGLADAREILDAALEAGVNFVDTADVYSGGESEAILGQAMAGRRERLVVATKVRFATGPGPNDAGLSAAHLVKSCEDSLKRLRTDRIDLYQVHAWDGLTALEETFAALERLTAQGKILFSGCSNFSAWHIYKANCAARVVGARGFVSHQIYYSPIGREAERELIPASMDLGMGNLVWSPLAGGLMTGKYRRDRDWPKEGRHSKVWDEPPVNDWNHTYGVVEAIVEVAEALEVTPAQVSLSYLLSKPGVTSLIVGARNRRQIDETLKAGDLVLPDTAVTAIDAASMLPLPYPQWHQARTITDRLSPFDLIALGKEKGSSE